MDITMQITEGWDEDMASQVTNLFAELSEKYGDKFDEVLSLIDGFVGSSISEFWQQEENEEGNFNNNFKLAFLNHRLCSIAQPHSGTSFTLI